MANILIIEDDDAIRMAIRIKLTKSGYTTKEAADGESGLNAIKNQGPFDVVLLDLRMPNEDGIGFLEKKNADESVKNIPVIVFTNLVDREFSQKAVEQGIKGYIIKAHHSVEDMIKEVEKCLKGEPCLMEV